MLGLGLGALALNVFVVLMAGFALRRSWRIHQDQAAATTLNLAMVLDRYVADTFSKADFAIQVVKDEIERREGDPRADLRGLESFIRREHGRLPELLALRTFDARGDILCGSGVGTGLVVNIADRDYFIRLREDPKAGLVLAQPVLGRLAGTWVINVARRVEHRDGSFGGIVNAVISLEQIRTVFASLDVGPHGSVALRGQDLGLIVRHPEPTGAGTAIGQKVVSREFAELVRAGQIAGTFRTLIPFDRTWRTIGVQKVTGLPYYLSVGLADQDYLADWRRERTQWIAGVGCFIVLTLAAAFLLRHVWQRRQAAHEAAEKLLAEVKTLGGMLPICSHCKKIRDDKGYWNQLEAYLNEHTDAEFTHGICPECAQALFPRHSGKQTSL